MRPELATALKTVAAGKVYLSPTLTGVVVEDFVRGGGTDDGTASAFSFTMRKSSGQISPLSTPLGVIRRRSGSRESSTLKLPPVARAHPRA